jgi:hypothetical protein
VKDVPEAGLDAPDPGRLVDGRAGVLFADEDQHGDAAAVLPRPLGSVIWSSGPELQQRQFSDKRKSSLPSGKSYGTLERPATPEAPAATVASLTGQPYGAREGGSAREAREQLATMRRQRSSRTTTARPAPSSAAAATPRPELRCRHLAQMSP